MKSLVTKLNGTVKNDDLLKIGEFRVTFKPTKENDVLLVLSDFSKITAIFDHQVKTDSGVIGANAMTQLTGNIKAVSTDVVKASLFKKYDFPSFIGIQHGEFELDALEYCKNITSIQLTDSTPNGSLSIFSKLPLLTTISDLSGNLVYGDLSDLLGLSKLSKLMMSCPNVTGDIAVLKKMTSLKTWQLYNCLEISGDIKELAYLDRTDFSISITGTKVSGNLEDFVKAKREKGINSGTVKFNWIGNGLIKFNGIAIANVKDNTLSWTNSTITFNDETINI